MKQFFRITILLFFVLILLVGCKNNDNDNDNWTKSLNYAELDEPFSRIGNSFIFTKSDVESLGIKSGYFFWDSGKISETAVTGFKVKYSCSSRESGHGLLLFDIDGKGFYEISLKNGWVLFKKVINGYETDLINDNGNGIVYYWTNLKSSINLEPNNNEVVLYTLPNGALKLVVNDITITTVEKPDFQSFYIKIHGVVDSQDKGSVTSKFDFQKFQISE